MTLVAILILAFANASVPAAAPINAGPPARNSMEVVIGNGPHAGTYKLPAAN